MIGISNLPKINISTDLSVKHNNNSDLLSTAKKPKISINPEIICIDDDLDQENSTNNNIDAKFNRNIDNMNDRMSDDTITKDELSDDLSSKHMNRAIMTLSNDPIVNTTDLINVTKILSECDHHLTPTQSVIKPNVNVVDAIKIGQDSKEISKDNDSKELKTSNEAKAKTDTKIDQNHLSSIPMDENENFLLDIVYKCLRGKGVRMTNSYHSNQNRAHGKHSILCSGFSINIISKTNKKKSYFRLHAI